MVPTAHKGWYKGPGLTPALFYAGGSMARKYVSAQKHAKKFNNTAKYTKAINQPRRNMRGGTRL